MNSVYQHSSSKHYESLGIINLSQDVNESGSHIKIYRGDVRLNTPILALGRDKPLRKGQKPGFRYELKHRNIHFNDSFASHDFSDFAGQSSAADRGLPSRRLPQHAAKFFKKKGKKRKKRRGGKKPQKPYVSPTQEWLNQYISETKRKAVRNTK